MFELTGKYGTAKVYATTVEDECISQIYGFMNSPVVEDCKVAIMPDCHAGKGAVIGFTQTIKDRVNPNMVGVDIGCFTKDTKVALTDGRNLSFEELISEKDKEHYGYSLDKDGHVQVSKLEFARKIKHADKLLEIELDNGEKVKCTFDHIFYKRDGKEVEAQNLSVGDSLYPLYIKPAKEVFENSNDEHLCIFDGKTSEYILIHKLSDDYNERHGLGIHFSRRGYVRHHKDFNKFNNDPTNIERVLFEDHFKIHAENLSETNKLGITGFTAAFKKHPDLASRAGKERSNVTWNGINSEKNRIAAKERITVLNKSSKMRQLSSERQIEHNTTKFTEQNKYEWFKNRQKIGRIKKVLQYLRSNNLTCTEDNYNKARLNFYNYMYYKDAKHLVESLGLTFEKVLSGETVINHKVISIKEIPGDDVYCLTCQEYGNFALASGVFVHNCGMLVLKIAKKSGDIIFNKPGLEKFDKIMHTKIPSGMKHRDTLHKFAKDFTEINDLITDADYNKELYGMGSLGGGNHFVEIDKDENGDYYIVIHSGSRHLGIAVAGYWEKKAVAYHQNNSKAKSDLIAKLKKEGREKDIAAELAKLPKVVVSKDLSYLEGEDVNGYLHDMKICQEFARLSREAMLDVLVTEMGIKKHDILDKFCTIHNYIDIENRIVRKGSISLQKDELAVIPINMSYGSLIVKGKGNPDWNFSGPHGAGRLMSRSKAKETLKMEDFKESMKDVYTTSVCVSTIDEAPMAYKPADEILENIKDNAEIISIIKPIYNFKSSDD